MNNGLTNTYVHALAINASGQIFAGTWGSGVFLSTDNGESWTEVSSRNHKALHSFVSHQCRRRYFRRRRFRWRSISLDE